MGASFALADVYFWGKCTRIDHKRAFVGYERAAELGNFNSQHQVGDAYWYGKWGYPQSYAKARAWHEKAAAQRFPPSMGRLALMKLNGDEGKGGWGGVARCYWRHPRPHLPNHR